MHKTPLRAKKRQTQPPPDPEPATADMRSRERLQRNWLPRLAAFLKNHSDWRQCVECDDAVYCLPEAFLSVLTDTSGHRRRTPIIDREQAAAERGFCALCEESSPDIIGVCLRQPIWFGLFWREPMAEPLSPEERASTDRATLGDRAIRIMLAPSAEEITHRRQRLAYAGALTLHMPYQLELGELRAAWEALPAPKPAFGPWNPEGCELAQLEMGQPRGRSRGKQKYQRALDYYRRYNTFRSRWHLDRLAAWDLPHPSGRWRASVGVVLMHLGSQRIVDYCPPYLAAAEQQPKQQIAEARSTSRFLKQWHNPTTDLSRVLDEGAELPEVPGIGGQGSGESLHGLALRMLLLETAVRQRYPNARHVKTAVMAGFAQLADLSIDRVKEARRLYQNIFDDGSSSSPL